MRLQDRIKLSLSQTGGTPTDPKKILVPIDFSSESKEAIPHAARIAHQSGSEVILLHVIETLPLQVAIGHVPREVKKGNYQLVRQGEAVLARLGEETIGPLIRCRPVVRIGVPYQVIVNLARKMAVDLIVITTHGYTGLRRALVGSTIERVVRHAHCAVLVIHE